MITLPSRVQLDTLPSLIPELEDAASCDELVLDLRDVEAVEGHAGPVLAVLLLSGFGDVDAEIFPPRSDELLARTGIAFALANRPGKTSVLGEDASMKWPAWRQSWVPGSRATVDALFRPEAVGESADAPNLIGRRYAAFVNPHLARPSGEHHEVVNLLHPWLRELLPRSQRTGGLLDDFGSIVTELVENVRQHAPRTASGRPARSLVQVWWTHGAEDRLYVSVLDTGPGILATARGKVVDGHRLKADELLHGLLVGKVARRDPTRGFGLPDVWKMADTRGAGLWLSTADRVLSCEGGEPHVRPVSTQVDGTVVTLRFTLGT